MLVTAFSKSLALFSGNPDNPKQKKSEGRGLDPPGERKALE